MTTHLTIQDLAERIERLALLRYRDRQPVATIRFLAGSDRVGQMPPHDERDWSEVALGHEWEAIDRYAWLAIDVTVPANWKGRTVVGRFDFGTTDYGNASGFEGLLFVDGKPYQGVDSNHTEVLLPDDSVGKTLKLRFRLWAGFDRWGGREPRIHVFSKAELAWLDPSADDFYFTSKAILDALQVLDPASYEYRALHPALSRALDKSGLFKTDAEPRHSEFETVLRDLKQDLSELKKKAEYQVHAVGHAHIDVAWLWRLMHTREKSARTFSTALRLMDRYPEFCFQQSQPQLYEYLGQDYPELYDQVLQRIREGRWEAGGAMWLEPDCNLTSGESLVRQLLFGTRFLREELGTECRYLWLPDTFGFSAALPQIMKLAGIEVLMTTKLSWNEVNRMPHDTFRWRGIDGSEVLAHFITTPFPDIEMHTYSGEMDADSVTGIWREYVDKELNQDLLLAYGYGDGGGGVNRDMLEMRRRLDRLPGMPSVTTGHASDFFAKLARTVKEAGDTFPAWEGELYLERHRGTYTSQAWNKYANRKLELALREAEILGVIGALLKSEINRYPRELLNAAWKIVLRNQFHDILPGTSIAEVHQDSKEELEEAFDLVEIARDDSLERMGSSADRFTVFNCSPWDARSVVNVETSEDLQDGGWLGPDGQVLASQRTRNGWIVRTPLVPAMGFEQIRFRAGGEHPSPSPFTVSDSAVSGPFYDIAWNEHGHLTRIFSSALGRDLLCKDGRGNVLQLFDDVSKKNMDAWDLDFGFEDSLHEIEKLVSVETIENGPVQLVLRFVWTGDGFDIRQDMVLYAHSPRIDFRTHVDWRVRQTLLKVAFAVDVNADEATYDIAFGNLRRPTHWNTSWDKARFEVPAHQWADLSGNGFGVSLMNDCKYGYDIHGNVMRLSLLRSPILPDPLADHGVHEFTYSILPHNGDWFEGGTVQSAWDLNQPLRIASVVGEPDHFRLFRLNADNVMIDAVKLAEDSDRIVLRLHEFAGRSGPIEIACGFPLEAWWECDLLEQPVSTEQSSESLRFFLNPHEIKTFLLERKETLS